MELSHLQRFSKFQGAEVSFYWFGVVKSKTLITKHYLKQHETDLLEDLLPPSTTAVRAADNQDPLMHEEDSW